MHTCIHTYIHAYTHTHTHTHTHMQTYTYLPDKLRAEPESTLLSHAYTYATHTFMHTHTSVHTHTHTHTHSEYTHTDRHATPVTAPTADRHLAIQPWAAVDATQKLPKNAAGVRMMGASTATTLHGTGRRRSC